MDQEFSAPKNQSRENGNQICSTNIQSVSYQSLMKSQIFKLKELRRKILIEKFVRKILLTIQWKLGRLSIFIEKFLDYFKIWMIMAFILIKIFWVGELLVFEMSFRFKSFRGRWINKISLSFEILYHETSFEMIYFSQFFFKNFPLIFWSGYRRSMVKSFPLLLSQKLLVLLYRLLEE